MEKIILVDGFKIRNTRDDDFGLIHRHSTNLAAFEPKYYIPSGQIWLDYRYVKEKDFLLATLDYRPLSPTVDPKTERELMKKDLCQPGPTPEFVISRARRDGLTVVSVNGTVVRRYLDPEFILGGHDLVYSYIPPNEIWLDHLMDPAEIDFIFLHEKIERELMQQGKIYDLAHEYATIADKEARRRGGVAAYPMDPTYPWSNLTNEEIINRYYVINESSK
ncbi:MAG: hypothetical protein AAB505_00190 [Patescibacteria group bacterium]